MKLFAYAVSVCLIFACVLTSCSNEAQKTDEQSVETTVSDETATDEKYHIKLTHLNESQLNIIKTYRGEVVEAAKYYTVQDVTEYEESGETFYDVKIKFKGDSVSKCRNQFKAEYYDPDTKTGALVYGANCQNVIGYEKANGFWS